MKSSRYFLRFAAGLLIGSFFCCGFAAADQEQMLSPEITIGSQSLAGAFYNLKHYEVLERLKSENWVEVRNAVQQVMEENIIEAEDSLIGLLESDKVGLLKVTVEALESLNSKRSVGRLIELFQSTKESLRFRDVSLAILDALGQNGSEQAMVFLINALEDKVNNVIVKKRICRNLGFYEQRKAVDALIKFCASGQNMATQEAMVSLGYTASADDLEVIKNIAMNIKGRERTQAVELYEKEGFGDNADYFHWLFISGAAEKIHNRNAERNFVLGDVRVRIDEDAYLQGYTESQAQRPKDKYASNIEYWKNPDIAALYIGSKQSEELLKQSVVVLNNNEEHPDVQKILDVLFAYNIKFHRSKDGLMLVREEDKQLALWSKDGSVLMPGHKGYIPFTFLDASFPVRGETVIFPGKDPLLIMSDSVSTAVVPLSKKFPDLDINLLPGGFVTYRLKNQQDVLIGTSHIDCVIECIPGELTYDAKPIIIIDPRYYDELLLRENSRALLGKLQSKYRAKIVVVEKEEAYLNPANFIQLPEGRIMMNKAPKTINNLLASGLKPEKLLVLKEAVSSLAALKGMIGCLGGIYTDDRIPLNFETDDKPLKKENDPTLETKWKVIEQAI